MIETGDRGPTPESLSALFRLKYQEGITDQRTLAERLGVSVETIGKYERRLYQKLVRCIGQVSEDRLHLVCPDCLKASVFEDSENGERVCHSCGYTQPGIEKTDDRLDFGTTYALSSDLAVDKSLGGTLGRRGTLRMLAKSNGAVDLGIRARQVRILTETNEPPRLARMLEKAYEISKRFSLEGDKLFNNDLGRNVRRAFWLARELGVNPSCVAETAFWITAAQYGKRELVSEGTLKVNQPLLDLTIKMNHLLLVTKKTTVAETEYVAVRAHLKSYQNQTLKA